MDWASDPMAVRVAELRALLARSLSAAADLGSAPSRESTSNLTMYLVPSQVGATYATPDHEAAARAIGDAWGALAPSFEAPDRVITTEGHFEGEDAGAWTVLGTVVLGMVIAAVAYVATESLAVVDNHLARKAQSAQLVNQIAGITKIAEDHTAAERKAGHPIGFNEAQRLAISTLSRTAETVAARTTAPIASSGGSWWLMAAGCIVGGVAVHYWEHRRRK